MTTRRGPKATLESQVAQVLGSDEASIFGPAFFLRQLAGFVRARCPHPGESFPVVEITLHDGNQLDLCHVVGLAPRWAALAAYAPAQTSRGHAMQTELVPYASITRVTIRAERSTGSRLGFNQAQPPAGIESIAGGTPEMMLRAASTPSDAGAPTTPDSPPGRHAARSVGRAGGADRTRKAPRRPGGRAS